MTTTMTAQDKKNAVQEDTIARSKSLNEEQKRVALLEKNLKDMQRLAQLKAEVAALSKSLGAASAGSGVASAVVAASAGSGIAPAAVAVSAASQIKPRPIARPAPAPQPSLSDQILGEPLFLVAGVAILLGLCGTGFFIFNRRKLAATDSIKNKDAGATRIIAPVAPSPDTGDFTGATEVEIKSKLQQGEVDPISEAELFLNFGRDAQAEEILKEALLATPGNHLIQLKLLSIYASRKNADAFLVAARQLKDTCDEDTWNQAAAMGRKLDPNNQMYRENGFRENDSSVSSHTAEHNATPDLVREDMETVQEKSIQDVNLDLSNVKQPLSTDDNAAAQAGVMDFDVASTESQVASTDLDNILASFLMPPSTAEVEAAPHSDLIFEITAIQPPMPQSSAVATQDDGMGLTFDFKPEDVADKPVLKAHDAGFEGINLNFDDSVTSGKPVTEVRDEHWNEVVTKFDLARAYQEMGDATGAREILQEILLEGDAGQREAAQSMIDKLG